VLTTPLALIGLAAVPALLAVYLLRNRVIRREVSSLMLWVERSRMDHGGAKLQRNRLPLLFFLELLILLLLIWAATGPRVLSMQATRPLTVVLDNSASMDAVGRDGQSSAQRALKRLPKLVKKERFAPIQVILAGHEPRWLGADAVDALLKGNHMDEWNMQAPVFDVEKALLLARAGSHPGTKLLLISDARPEQPPEGGRLRWLATGRPLPNAGFVNAVRSGDRCMVELQGSGTVQMTLTLGIKSQTVPVELEQGKPRRMVYRLNDPSAPFKASLPNDALAIDNHVLLLPTPERRMRVIQNVQHPELKLLVARAVESMGMQAVTNGPIELLITDSSDAVTDADTWVLHLTQAQKAAPFTGPFVLNYVSPLMEGISLDGLVWAGSSAAQLPGMPIVMAGNIPLLTRMDDLVGRARFFIQIDPELSTLQYSPAWPALFWNLIEARAALQPGFREVNLRPGMTPDFTGSAPLPELGTPGLIEVESDGTIFRAAYNFLDAAESQLAECGHGDDGDWLDPETLDRHYADLTPLVLLAALTLLAGHQFLLRRESQLAGEG
jgi:hypothetical protein